MKRGLRAKEHACGAEPQTKLERLFAEGWDMRRRPKCNRPIGHASPHKETRPRDAKVMWEWER